MTQKQQLDLAYVDGLVDDGLRSAIIDIDGTISASNIGDLYFFMKKNEYGFVHWAAWYTSFILSKYPYFILLDSRDRSKAQQAVYALYSKYTAGQIETMSQKLFKEVLSQRIFPQTEQLIKHLQARGVSIILLSSNIEPIVQQYAAHFKANEYYAIPLDKICGSVAAADYFLEFKEQKFAQINGASNALVVADSFHDLPILSQSKFPVIVTKKEKAWMDEVPNASFVYI